jgi:hypothetical protein
MVELCGDDDLNWEPAAEAEEGSIRARLELRDAIADRIETESPELQLMGLS